MTAWLEVLKADRGPLLRPVDRHGNILPTRLSSDAVSNILRDRLAHIGLEAEGYSGHSLRAGFVTSAIKAGAMREFG